MSSATATPVARTEVASPPAATPNPAAKYVVELIGTFFLVFTVSATAVLSDALAPLAVGSALMVMVYAGGHVSGGHYNPAVTLAVLIRGRIGLVDAVAYWITQFVAGVLAALLVRWVFSSSHVTALHLSGHTEAASFVVELLFTFALCYVVLNVATSKDNPLNSFYGLAIGFTILTGAVAVGAISGAAFNPAVAIGVATVGIFAWSTIWIYLVAQVAAGILAGLVFRALNPSDT